jgi:hypothetical protein
MSFDPLKQLLQDADARLAHQRASVAPGALATRVQRVFDRRLRRRRLALASAGVVAVVSLGVLFIERQQRPNDIATTARPVDSTVTLASLHAARAEADLHEAVVSRVLGSRTETAKRKLPVSMQSEEAALLLIYQGDRLAKDPQLREPAAMAYRQASEAFPGTHAAATARQRLEAIN